MNHSFLVNQNLVHSLKFLVTWQFPQSSPLISALQRVLDRYRKKILTSYIHCKCCNWFLYNINEKESNPDLYEYKQNMKNKLRLLFRFHMINSNLQNLLLLKCLNIWLILIHGIYHCSDFTRLILIYGIYYCSDFPRLILIHRIYH